MSLGYISAQAELFGDPLINVYGDEVRFPCWNASAGVKRWMSAHGVKTFQQLTEHFWRRFAAEVAPAVYNASGTVWRDIAEI